MRLRDKSWKEAGSEGMRDKTVFIPLGSIEQHGPHLPLDTDTLIAERVSEELAKKFDGLVAPSLHFGISLEHLDFPGTITLESSTLKAILSNVVGSLRRHGFKKIVVVNGHGGNRSTLKEIDGIRWVDVINKIKGYDHAGEIEASIMMHLYPGKVRHHEISEFEYEFPGKKEWRMIEHSKSGVLGDAHKASAEKGKKYFEEIVSKLVEELASG